MSLLRTTISSRNLCRSFLTARHTTRNTQTKRLFRTSHARQKVEEEDDIEIEDPGLYEVILPPDPPIWGVKHITPRTVPDTILKPPYVTRSRIANRGKGSLLASTNGLPENVDAGPDSTVNDDENTAANFNHDPYSGDGRIKLGSEDEKRLRRAGHLAKRVLEMAGTLVRPGVTTNEIDAAVHAFIVANNAYPSPLLYSGFPRSCCTSVNNVVVHGIPDDRPLVNGDIVNIDITVFLDGFHGDTSQTFAVGDVDPVGRHLVQSSLDALEVGIQVCGPGVPFKAIGAAVHELARSRDLSISEQFTGHGIGTVFHRPPWILHHRNDEPGTMQPGHCFTIEPALIVGRNPLAWTFPDGWTASTTNGCRSAQAEHTVLITESGVDVLTK